MVAETVVAAMLAGAVGYAVGVAAYGLLVRLLGGES